MRPAVRPEVGAVGPKAADGGGWHSIFVSWLDHSYTVGERTAGSLTLAFNIGLPDSRHGAADDFRSSSSTKAFESVCSCATDVCCQCGQIC